MAPTAPEIDAPSGCFAAGLSWQGGPLSASRLSLRRPRPEDAEAFLRLAGDPAIASRTANIPIPYSLEQAQAFIAESERDFHQGKAVVLVLERLTDRVPVGCCGFNLWRDGSAEIGYWVGQPYWRQGYAFEAVRRLLRLLFTAFPVGLARAHVIKGNEASAGMLEKLGFSRCGEGRMNRPAHGDEVDAVFFSLAREEWQARHAARPMLLVAAAALVDGDGRVLLASRPPGKPMSGLWEFPGGKIHAGETPEQALIRELDEELGIDVRESCLAPLAFASHDYEGFHLLMPLYICRVWRGTVSPREGQSLAWVRAGKLASYPMPPADVPLVAILRDWL